MATLADLLEETRGKLEAAGIPDALLEARMLVRRAAAVSQVSLLTDHLRAVTLDQQSALDAMVNRRIAREPLQYVLGSVEFHGREFLVDRRVLIPRPETELLVEQAQLRLSECKTGHPLVLDIGTGSGILALTVAAEIPEVRVIATDISSDALDVARTNAVRIGVSNRVEFVHGSLAAGLDKRFDMVLSNPPYVRSTFLDGTDVQPELAWEPREALDGGEGGMAVYRELLPSIRGVLKNEGAAYVEIDPPVAEDCVALAQEQFPSAFVSVLTDLSGLERCLSIERTCR